MPDKTRLTITVPLHADQSQAAQFLLNMEGLCTCGRHLLKTDSRFVLGNAIASQKALVLAAYCYDCFRKINGLLARLKGSMGVLDPEERRYTRGA